MSFGRGNKCIDSELYTFFDGHYNNWVEIILPQESFIKIPVISERFSSATSLQYYHLLPTLDNFVSYIQEYACHDTRDSPCHKKTSTIQSASYVDIDFDAISHSLSINAFWDASVNPHGWSETVEKSRSQDKIEVGVLEAEKPTEPEELSLSGFLTVVGEDDKPGTCQHHESILDRTDSKNSLTSHSQHKPASPFPLAIIPSRVQTRATPSLSHHPQASTQPCASLYPPFAHPLPLHPAAHSTHT